jgi:hypothetical protein
MGALRLGKITEKGRRKMEELPLLFSVVSAGFRPPPDEEGIDKEHWDRYLTRGQDRNNV